MVHHSLLFFHFFCLGSLDLERIWDTVAPYSVSKERSCVDAVTRSLDYCTPAGCSLNTTECPGHEGGYSVFLFFLLIVTSLGVCDCEWQYSYCAWYSTVKLLYCVDCFIAALQLPHDGTIMGMMALLDIK